MKYSEILHFEPITDVIQFNQLDDRNYQKQLVETFVYPDYFIETILPEIVRNMTFGAANRKGIQIIGNYGTGKSHLMSLVQLVAEYSEYLTDVRSEKAKSILSPIAGKFKVHRFELAQGASLWQLVTNQIQHFLDANEVDYHFDLSSLKMYYEQIEEMLAAFEAKFPDKGFMLVIDEMLSYLKGRVSTGELNQDLQVLQCLAQACAKGRFCFMFGVQEIIYESTEFAFATEMMLKVKDRYSDLTIRKEDVSYVVQNRLLKKTDTQKAQIRTHLQQFVQYFSDIHSHLDEYVNLFPVHPSYFDNFQRLRLGSSQREVLKTLSKQFELLKDETIPKDNPGLITYDLYWEQLARDKAMMAIPDFKTVADTVKIVHDKIDNNFDGVRAKQIPLAKRITNACAIKILQANLDKQNGARAEVLVDDLCCTFSVMENRDFLIDQVKNCANLITRATSGQYFELNEENSEYRLRTAGGVNFDQQIIQYAQTSMTPLDKDNAFYKFIVQIMEITANPYMTGFQIYQHELPWLTHKVSRDGYIFLGGVNEKSTTHPKQHFYIIFMPIFQENKKHKNLLDDEVYFVMDNLSQEFKDAVCLYGSAFSLMNSADSAQKTIYKAKEDEHFKKARRAFDACYLEKTKVFYKDQSPKTLREFQLPGGGASKMDIFNAVSSILFEEQFTDEAPNYPSFVSLRQPMTNENRDRYIKAAITKEIRPTESNIDGEAILSGLNLFHSGEITTDDSIYAQSLMALIDGREQQMVVNKEEIITLVPKSQDIWRTNDFNIESDLEFIVIAALVYQGKCDIKLSNGEEINASSMLKFREAYEDGQHYTFAFIKRPKGVNIPLIKAITKSLCGEDLSGKLDKSETYARIVTAAKQYSEMGVLFSGQNLSHGAIRINGIEIFSEDAVTALKNNLLIFTRFCDKLQTYTSEAKIKNLQFDSAHIDTILKTKEDLVSAKEKLSLANRLNAYIVYLTQARQYLPEGTLATNIESSIGKYTAVISNVNEAQVTQYQEELEQLKKKYIDWYLGKYKDVCLSSEDMNRKIKVLNSAQYKVCSILVDCTVINTSSWGSWKSMFVRLKDYDPNINDRLLSSPYIGFNPLQEGESTKSLHELIQDLDDFYALWLKRLKDFVGSEESVRALSLMDEPSRQYANEFVNGFRDPDDDNSARSLLAFVKMLCEGFEEVTITPDELADVFVRPMTTAEAQAAFDHFIFKKTSGKKPDKVRIIFRS